MFNSIVILPSQPSFRFQPLFPILLQSLGGTAHAWGSGQSARIHLADLPALETHLNPPCWGCELFHPSLLSRHCLLFFSLSLHSSLFLSQLHVFPFLHSLLRQGKKPEKRYLLWEKKRQIKRCANQGKESLWLSTKTHFMEGVWLAKCSTSHLSSGKTKLMYTAGDCNFNKPRNKMNKTSCFPLPPWSLRSWATRPPSNQMFQARSSFQSLCISIIVHLILS